ncbi:MAG: hypothetical protein ACYDBB_21645 [Armatimonadota bacterium]
MQMMLAAIATAAAVVGVIFASLPRGADTCRARWRSLSSAGLRPLLVFTGVLVAVFFLLTLPAARPFSAGMTLGWGFLIGSLLGIYAIFAAAGAGGEEERNIRIVGLLSAAVLGPSVILLLFHGYPNDALIGCALGAVLVAAIYSGVLRPLEAAAPVEGESPYSVYRGIEIFALATVAIAAGAYLGINHQFPNATTTAVAGGYWALPAIAVAAGALGLTLLSSGLLQRFGDWRAFIAGLFSAFLAVIVIAALQVKLLPGLSWSLALYGLLAFGFVQAVLIREEQQAPDRATLRPVALAFGTVIFTLAMTAIAFTMLRGYGQALVMLPALLLISISFFGRRSSTTPLAESLGIGVLSVLLLLTLYRVFLEKVGQGWRLDFQQQYDMFAVLLGVGVSFGVLAFAMRGIEDARRHAEKIQLGMPLVRTMLLGFFLAIVPVALVAVWGVKAGGAFLVGLVIGQVIWVLLTAWVVGEERRLALAAMPHIFFLATALVAIQFSPLVLALNLTGLEKRLIVGVIALAVIAWILVDAFLRSRAPQGGGSHETA